MPRPVQSCAKNIDYCAAQRFPDAPEVEFWKRCIAWADLGETFDPADCQKLLHRKPGYFEPAVHLQSAERDPQYRPQAEMLLKQYQNRRTLHEKYMVSVIESALRHQSPRV